MWKDPIVEELHCIRAALASKHAGLKGLHKRALQVQRTLRARGTDVVNLHKGSRTYIRSSRGKGVGKGKVAV